MKVNRFIKEKVEFRRKDGVTVVVERKQENTQPAEFFIYEGARNFCLGTLQDTKQLFEAIRALDPEHKPDVQTNEYEPNSWTPCYNEVD